MQKDGFEWGWQAMLRQLKADSCVAWSGEDDLSGLGDPKGLLWYNRTYLFRVTLPGFPT